MVPPTMPFCGLAETMTPPIAAPSDDLTVPLRMVSAANAGLPMSAITSELTARDNRMLRMDSS